MTSRAWPKSVFDRGLGISDFQGAGEVEPTAENMTTGSSGQEVSAELPGRTVINALHAAVGIPGYDAGNTATQNEVIGQVIDERVRELFMEVGARYNDHLQAFLRDFQAQAKAAYRDGLTIPAAARRMDFRAHAARYPQLADTADTYDRLEGGLQRVYDQLAGKVPQ